MHQHSHASNERCGHTHHAPGKAASIGPRRLALSIGLTVGFAFAEALTGWFANSLSLLSDAGHNLADAAALVLTWWGLWMAGRPSTSGMTFGFHRVGIMAALVNSLSLVLMAGLICWDAIERFREPSEVEGWPMLIVAALAVGLNLLIGSWLHAHQQDLNVRSAYLHMLGDALSACGVMVAAGVILVTGFTVIDPAVSLAIAALILVSSWGILKESVNVLLEGTPAGVDMPAVEQSIREVEGVLDVHDLHVWMIGAGVIACSCHVVVAEQSIRSGQQVLKGVAQTLETRFGINHTTIQVEVEGCDPNAIYCNVEPLR